MVAGRRRRSTAGQKTPACAGSSVTEPLRAAQRLGVTKTHGANSEAPNRWVYALAAGTGFFFCFKVEVG
jgi:hypothetical protein